MERAKEQGLVESYRRPKVYLGETDVDFVNLNGYKKYELKAVTQNERKSYQDSAKDIIKNIQDQLQSINNLDELNFVYYY
jgi:hypothetical protein